ncbi:histone-lysine N-methyltransferase SETMAR [Trichonephila clavipes]|nr:histone-lysine N-methyltransferase SETMAR [Trichonephila clavipes]
MEAFRNFCVYDVMTYDVSGLLEKAMEGSRASYYVQFWFHRFRSGIFDVKDAPRTGRPVVENVDKIAEIIEVAQLISSRSSVQELKNDHKIVLNHLRKVGFKKRDV